jgi:hypothetical protein
MRMNAYKLAMAALLPLTVLACSSPPDDGVVGSSADELSGPGSTILWQQPSLAGIIGHLYVPSANKSKPAIGQFGLLLWQPDPKTSNGLLVPTTWAAGEKTGFDPSGTGTELAFQNMEGSSTVQASGRTVGAYLNSADLTAGSNEYKMMITPQIDFAGIAVFASADSLRVSLELQVPTATDGMQKESDTYVNSDLLFTDPSTGVEISFSGGMFHHGTQEPAAVCNVGTDPATGNVMVNCPLLPGAPYVTVGTASAHQQFATWRGFKAFAYSVSKAQFAAALVAVHDTYPKMTVSLNPGDYMLIEWHLNAELHYQTAAATLGWSMADAVIHTN